jgi:hypothetical protein
MKKRLDNRCLQSYLANKYDTGENKRMATVYLREFPEQLHRELKARAALMGISMRDLVVKAVERFLEDEKKREKKGGK